LRRTFRTPSAAPRGIRHGQTLAALGTLFSARRQWERSESTANTARRGNISDRSGSHRAIAGRGREFGGFGRRPVCCSASAWRYGTDGGPEPEGAAVRARNSRRQYTARTSKSVRLPDCTPTHSHTCECSTSTRSGLSLYSLVEETPPRRQDPPIRADRHRVFADNAISDVRSNTQRPSRRHPMQ